MKKFLLTFAALVAVLTVSAQSATVVIPRPLEATQTKGSYVVTPKTVISVSDESLVRSAEIFAEYVAKEGNMTLAVEKGGKKGIILSIDKNLGKEEYTLDVTSKGISINGGTPQGVFYGLQSLRQMLSAGQPAKKGVELQAVSIKDKPLLGYRGAHRYTAGARVEQVYWHRVTQILASEYGWKYTKSKA